MDAVIQSFLSGFPVLISHFTATFLVFVAASFIYTIVTPHHETKLIKQGNVSAAISLGGVLLGLSIPLAFCLAGSINVFDIIVWGSVTLALQLIVYFVIDFFLRGISKSIEKDELAPSLFLVSVKLSVAFINAAAIAG